MKREMEQGGRGRGHVRRSVYAQHHSAMACKPDVISQHIYIRMLTWERAASKQPQRICEQMSNKRGGYIRRKSEDTLQCSPAAENSRLSTTSAPMIKHQFIVTAAWNAREIISNYTARRNTQQPNRQMIHGYIRHSNYVKI